MFILKKNINFLCMQNKKTINKLIKYLKKMPKQPVLKYEEGQQWFQF